MDIKKEKFDYHVLHLWLHDVALSLLTVYVLKMEIKCFLELGKFLFGQKTNKIQSLILLQLHGKKMKSTYFILIKIFI